MRDQTGLRLPGFLETQVEGDTVSVLHHAWSNGEWKAIPMLQNIGLSTMAATAGSAHQEAS